MQLSYMFVYSVEKSITPNKYSTFRKVNSKYSWKTICGQSLIVVSHPINIRQFYAEKYMINGLFMQFL